MEGQWLCGPQDLSDRDAVLLEEGETCTLATADPMNSLLLIEIDPCETAPYRP